MLTKEGEEVDGGTVPREGPVTAPPKEFASMRLKVLPKKRDMRGLNNLRGTTMPDTA